MASILDSNRLKSDAMGEAVCWLYGRNPQFDGSSAITRKMVVSAATSSSKRSFGKWRTTGRVERYDDLLVSDSPPSIREKLLTVCLYPGGRGISGPSVLEGEPSSISFPGGDQEGAGLGLWTAWQLRTYFEAILGSPTPKQIALREHSSRPWVR